MDEIKIWKGVAPGSEGVSLEGKIYDEVNSSGEFKQLSQFVLEPSLIPFIPEKPYGSAILIIPGGGFRRQVLNIEGSEIAHWLNTLGIAAFVLRHRMPCDGHENKNMVPLQDAQRAIRVIRSLSVEYGFRENRVGAMGFSAGGHVAASLGTMFNVNSYNLRDSIDEFSSRPDFLALLYPVISYHSYSLVSSNLPRHAELNREMLTELALDRKISSETPQTFITVANDDNVTPAENSINFALGLRKHGIPVEMHIFKKAGHGFGLGKNSKAVSSWSSLFEEWFSDIEWR